MKARWVPSVAAATAPPENPPELPPAPRLTLVVNQASSEPVLRAVVALPAAEAWFWARIASISRFSSLVFLVI